jgi:hypothetical protein
MLHSPLVEIENTIFGILDEGVEVDVDVSRWRPCLSAVLNVTLIKNHI